MVVFPNAKINLGLHITEKRSDGYHDLQTVFYPVGCKDILEVIEANGSTYDINIHPSGLEVSGSNDQHLCVKAYRMLKKDFPKLPSVDVYLHKMIPMGAGLGGGSSDGAFMLQLLNKKFELELTNEQMIQYALQLGSDCPFFIYNSPCFAVGRGELLEPIKLDLSEYSILIVNPGIHVSTAQAFSWIQPKMPSIQLMDIITMPISSWRDNLRNDFEAPVAAHFPAIKTLKTTLYNHGAIYASMSGSGSTVYGIFPNTQHPDIKFPDSYFYKWV